MPSKVPKIEKTPEIQKQVKSKDPDSFYTLPICWRIGKFDIESKWGLNNASGKITFNYNNELLELVIDKNDNDLNKYFENIEGKEFSSINELFNNFKNIYNKDINSTIVHKLVDCLTANYFMNKIYPKLREYENLCWNEIDQQKFGGKGKSKNHAIEISKIIPEARKRLDKIGLSDLNEVYSLRLEGKLRVFGIRKQNFLEVLWIDTEHEICPSLRD